MFARLIESIAWRLFPWTRTRFSLPSGVSFPIRNRQEIRLFQEVILSESYPRLLDALPHPSTLLDLGCNSGYFTLLVEHRRRKRFPQQPPARALLVDANPDCMARCRESLALNHLADCATPLAGLIGPRGQEVDFYVSKADAHSSLFHAYCPRKTVRLAALDMDEMVRCHFPSGIDLVKVDIEGAEKYLLRDWRSALAGAKAIILEWHQFALEWEAARGALEGLGFRAQTVIQENDHQSTALFVK